MTTLTHHLCLLLLPKCTVMMGNMKCTAMLLNVGYGTYNSFMRENDALDDRRPQTIEKLVKLGVAIEVFGKFPSDTSFLPLAAELSIRPAARDAITLYLQQRPGASVLTPAPALATRSSRNAPYYREPKGKKSGAECSSPYSSSLFKGSV